MEANQSPLVGMFREMVPQTLNGMVTQNCCSQQEAQAMLNWLCSPNASATVNQFLGNMIRSVGTNVAGVTYQMMSTWIYEWIMPMIQQFRAQAAGGVGFRAPMPMGGLATRPTFGQTTSSFGMGANPLTGAPIQQRGFVPPPGSNAVIPGSGNNQPKPAPSAQQPIVNPPKKQEKWSVPTLEGKAQDIKVSTVVVANMARYRLSNGQMAARLIVSDPRIRYASDDEVIKSYRHFLDASSAQRKFLTVSYRQLKVLEVNKTEFHQMVSKIAMEVSKLTSLEAKIRCIMKLKDDYSVKCTNAFTTLVLDELNEHTQAGAFTESAHPKRIMMLKSFESILKLITGEMDAGVLNMLKAQKGFEEKLEAVLNNWVNSFICSLPQVIINPETDSTTLDDYTRVLPPIWSPDGGMTFTGSDDLFTLFLSTRSVINGSRTDGAVGAETELRNRITELNKFFTVVFLTRVVSWCNYPKTWAVGYAQNGDCVPAVFDTTAPTSDVQFFLSEALSVFKASKDSKPRFAPKNIQFEVDEEVYRLQYGTTTDGRGWVGTSKYWK